MMTRRSLLASLVPASLAYFWLRPGVSQGKTKNTIITFGSCNQQDRPQPIWNSILATNPDLFIFCGDNVYSDSKDVHVIQKAYDQLGANPQFKNFRRKIPIVATWDDHDYGLDDSDGQFPIKSESKEVMLDFFAEPKDSPRRQRDGVYTSYWLDNLEQKAQIILLDLRWWKAWNGALLGDQQWAWLEEQLRQPADLRFLVSSSQFAARGSPWDKWDDHPQDKARFLKLVDDLQLRNLVILSGDMHYGELSRQKTPGGIELIDFTSSGLNRWETAEGIDNSNRFALFDQGENFGKVEIDWSTSPLEVKLQLCDIRGKSVFEHIFVAE
jgi:alkaline phosphatase D